ncbi:MAG: SPOR domain-containing protein [Prevotellaceae bacterium]|jgi:hypothetical protein|nr:SPOR domain-containing protein [Prevotellaceae bacterium]
MIELAQHIEALLLENDCVTMPNLGGFVAHYLPAARVDNEHRFLPPTRSIGFNPQLTLNDGLLVQSYMSVYNISFPEASRLVEQQIDALFDRLQDEGKAELPHIGELSYNIENQFSFTPYNDRIATPSLYGLDAVELTPLPARQPAAPVEHPAAKQKPTPTIILHPAYLARAAAVAAIFLLLFLFSTPLENGELPHESMAGLVPQQLMEQLETLSIETTPVIAPPQPVQTPAPVVSKPYHLIIASINSQEEAKKMASALVAQGYADAKAIVGDGKIRIALASYPTNAEAYRALHEMRKPEGFTSVWVLKK